MGVVLVGKLQGNLNENDEVYQKAAELTEGQEPDGGYLLYNGMLFGEYKYTTKKATRLQPRFFGNWVGGDFYLCLYGNHKGQNYEGYTYDGKVKFSVQFGKPTGKADQQKLQLANDARKAASFAEAKMSTKTTYDPYAGLPGDSDSDETS
jgi:hypothetical protein